MEEYEVWIDDDEEERKLTEEERYEIAVEDYDSGKREEEQVFGDL